MRIRYYLKRLREQLWYRPLLFSALSVLAAFVAHAADGASWAEKVPEIASATNRTLLEIMASSMLVIATFAVGSMVSAYASASSTATPRSLPLIVSDDRTQNALSAFIGAFIYSLVALTAFTNGYYGRAGQFVLFLLTLLVFALVVLTFVRWVDTIARLGRMGNTIRKVEQATAQALALRRAHPTLKARAWKDGEDAPGHPVHASRANYVRSVDVAALQALAEDGACRIYVESPPGAFASADRPLATVVTEGGAASVDAARIRGAFLLGPQRVYDDDPRFGLIVLSEIAARALSPAVNDPGTAIDILGSFVRLLGDWARPADADVDADADADADGDGTHDRVYVRPLVVADLFDDAFTSTARDGARSVEVAVRLQKALAALAACGDGPTTDSAREHAREALARARSALDAPRDVERVLAAARRVDPAIE